MRITLKGKNNLLFWNRSFLRESCNLNHSQVTSGTIKTVFHRVRYVMTLLTMFCGYITNVFAQVKTTDSIFIKDSRPIQFIADKIQISEADKQWITDKLIPQLKELGDRGIIIERATASPEGPLPNNIRLAKGRRASVDALLSSYGINSGRIRYDVVVEDYPLLLALMKHEGDRQYLSPSCFIRASSRG